MKDTPEAEKWLNGLRPEMASKTVRDIFDVDPTAVHQVMYGVRPGAGRVEMTLDYVLTTEEFNQLQSDFPGINIHARNRTAHAHAYAAAQRHCQFIDFYSQMPMQTHGLYNEPALVLEVGANLSMHLRNPHPGAHLDSPIIDYRDSAREQTSDAKARLRIAQQKI